MTDFTVGFNLYMIKHPAGEFIGVGQKLEKVREHFGTKAEITLIDQESQITDLDKGKVPPVFLAF